MKRFLSTILTIVFVVCLFTGCDSDLEDVGNDPLEASGFDVTIEIECVENWIFSKYDVDVYVGDSLEGTIAHGDTKIFNLHLDRGTYALRFISAENDDLTGEATLHIHKDESLKYKISCNSSGIDVDTIVGTTPPNDDTNGGTETGYTLDYADAASFEAALNNDEKVNGKVVQFVVNSYKPDSALGINCWAGEHLNFISENELDVVAGDVIIGYVSEEPSEVLGSWKIPYIVLAVNEVKTNATIPTDSVGTSPEESTPPATSAPANMVGAPDDWTNLLEKHYEEVKEKFEDAGFTNITCVAHEIDYNENYVFEGSVVNIAIGENGEICTFEKGEQWPKDIKIRIDYRVKPVGEEKPGLSTTTTEPSIDTNPYNKVGDYSVYTKNEYAHIDSDVIRLGNSERVWISIEASPATLSMDDFIIDYDDTMLEIVDVTSSTLGDILKIELTVKAKKSGLSEIIICSGYELFEDAENAECYVLTVNGLNSKDGRVVYVTSTGEKYHYSASCVSSGTKTTLSDALAYEYEPCGKCVN